MFKTENHDIDNMISYGSSQYSATHCSFCGQWPSSHGSTHRRGSSKHSAVPLPHTISSHVSCEYVKVKLIHNKSAIMNFILRRNIIRITCLAKGDELFILSIRESGVHNVYSFYQVFITVDLINKTIYPHLRRVIMFVQY